MSNRGSGPHRIEHGGQPAVRRFSLSGETDFVRGALARGMTEQETKNKKGDKR